MTSSLDLLAAEWFAYKFDYFVRTNVPLRKRKTGGREGDADVIGIPPSGSGLPVIHIEASQAAKSLKAQLPDFRRKFDKADNDYVILTGVTSSEIRKIAIGGYAKEAGDLRGSAGFEVYTVPEFVKVIFEELKDIDVFSNAVPETFPMLRAIQHTLHFAKQYKWVDFK